METKPLREKISFIADELDKLFTTEIESLYDNLKDREDNYTLTEVLDNHSENLICYLRLRRMLPSIAPEPELAPKQEAAPTQGHIETRWITLMDVLEATRKLDTDLAALYLQVIFNLPKQRALEAAGAFALYYTHRPVETVNAICDLAKLAQTNESRFRVYLSHLFNLTNLETAAVYQLYNKTGYKTTS